MPPECSNHQPLAQMPLTETIGSIAGIAGLTFAAFVTTSYLELQQKIKEQVLAGEEPYELKIETKKRKKPAQKKPKRK
jgi:hypothetical protein